MRKNTLSPLSLSAVLALSLVLVPVLTTEAHAYLDGGTGSMLLQLLLGGVAGLAIAGKLYWYKFLSFFGVKPKSSATSSAASTDAERLTRS